MDRRHDFAITHADGRPVARRNNSRAAGAAIFPCQSKTLPPPANLYVFSRFFQRVSLKHMKNTNKEEGSVPGASHKNQGKKAPVTKLPRMEMYAVLGLELSKTIFEKLEEVEKSIDIMVRQKAWELSPDKPDATGK